MNFLVNALKSPKYRPYRVGTALALSALLIGGVATGEVDLPFLQQQVQTHEDRLTTVEGEVNALQDQASPSPTPVTTSAVNTPDNGQANPATGAQAAQPTPTSVPVASVTPAPVTAVSYVAYIGKNCSKPSRYVVTYSDGAVNMEPAATTQTFNLELPHTNQEDPKTICTL